jgi:hypothetical protein
LSSDTAEYDEVHRQAEAFDGNGLRRTNKWVEHVKAHQAKHKVSYKEALKQAKLTYKK